MSTIGGINMGNLTDYLFVFTNGSIDANWQGATKGYIGNVAVDGIQASERTSGSVPYAGTIYTNDNTLGAWQNIINQNPTQSSGVTNENVRLINLENDLVSALQQIIALPATPGFESVSSASLDGLNTQNGINEVFVINITSGLNFSNKINITGDPGDVYILRWDTDPATPGFQGQVKPQSGGAIVPHGGLKPTNFINVAGDINSSGGGTTPLPPYPQGPRYSDGLGSLIIGGSDFSGGGYFTGYWLTTGKPDIFDPATGLYYGETAPLSNGIFVGGWYTITTKFSMTSGTSGVYVSPNPATLEEPSIDVIKEVSPDNGVTWFDANTPPGPNIVSGTNPQFRFTVTNNGNQTLTNIIVTDDVYGLIGTLPSLTSGSSFQWIIVGTWALGQNVNVATATGEFDDITLIDTDPAYYVGVSGAIDVVKYVSPDNGVTWFDANTPPGPFIPSTIAPQFKYVVTNIGTEILTNVSLIDNKLGPITIGGTLNPGASFETIQVGTWEAGQQVNIATVTGQFNGTTVTDTDPAYYFGSVNPEISIQKYVSVDNGVTWIDANTPPGPKLNQGVTPQFKYVITNIGETPLTNIIVTDDVFGSIGTIPELLPGDSYEFIIP
ncbi:MAG: hypothetical protein ACM3O4_02775 [Ignavibacteriales bacterium]